MDDGQEQDQYEERLKEVFNSFDTNGVGSLCREELSELCRSLQLDDATPTLFQTLLQDQDSAAARVDFDQFKNALILVLSSTIEPQRAEPETEPGSPEIQPKFVKGSKRYGRRSTPEFIEPFSDSPEVKNANPAEEEKEKEEEDSEESDDSAVPRKRERWNTVDTSMEEFEAEGQMRVWNPDEPSTPRGSANPLSSCLEQRLREACSELAVTWDGCAGHGELLALCEHLGLELNTDLQQSLRADGVMSVQEFVSRAVQHNKPPTPSASTPYRQLKRHHSTQPFDEGGRRIAASALLTSTIGTCLFSTLDDGTGFTPADHIVDAWMEEGIENGTEILEALNFSLGDKLSLSDLTVALENELLATKNGIHQAAVASFKAEIRHLLDRVDREFREKEKVLSDLEKAEKLKNQLATEVDEHHSAIEYKNNLNLRKLEQDHKEKLAAVRSELMKEMDQLQQQAGRQREELEAEVQKIREDESFLRDHLSISVKENRRLEMELLDSSEKLLEAQSQISKLQTCVDNIMKERFGDLDPSSADFFLQEERIKQLRAGYEAQYRELQDRIDELQAELREFHSLGRVHQPCNNPLSEELESKSPGMESDPGIGSEEVQPFSMSLEAEMMLERLKEQHHQEMEVLQNQLESKISEFDQMMEKQRTSHEDQKAALALQLQQELQALREEMAGVERHAQELQSQLEQAELERTRLEQTRAEEREELENLREEEAASLRQQLLEAHTYSADLEEQLSSLEAQLTERDGSLVGQMEELKERHRTEMKELEERQTELFEARLEEERNKLLEEQGEMEKRLLEECKQDKEMLQRSHEEELKARLEEARGKFEGERDEIVQKLSEQWQKERAQLDEQNNETLQLLLEEEMLKLVREQEETQNKLGEQWEGERARLQEQQEEAFLQRLLQDQRQHQEQFEQREKKLREEWEKEKLQLEEDYEGMLQERLSEEREKFELQAEEEEKRLESLMAQRRVGLEESHLEAMKELTVKHSEERDALSSTLDKLREEIAQERREVETTFQKRIKEVEDRFSGDQESVEKRFQADVLKLEQHYQSELKALSESHAEQRLHWGAQLQQALESAEKERRTMEENVARERERLDQRWEKEKHELESLHEEKLKDLMSKNQQLQREVDELVSMAQTKEIELSRQLNDLHSRLQESLETRDQLLAQSEKKALESELLLNRTIEEFQQEKKELLSSRSELEAKAEMLCISELQTRERIELLTERDDLKMKIEELEALLRQAAVDFELERKELQDDLSVLQNRLKDVPEDDREELVAERDLLRNRIKDLELDLSRGLSSAEKASVQEDEEDDVDVTVKAPHALDEDSENTKIFDKTDGNVSASSADPGDRTDPAEGDEDNLVYLLKNPESPQEVGGDPEISCCSPENRQRDLYLASCEGHDPDAPVLNENHSDVNTAGGAVFPRTRCEEGGEVQGFEGVNVQEGGENGEAPESCEEGKKPQDVPASDDKSPSCGDEPCHETAVEDPALEEKHDPDEMFLVDFEVPGLSLNSHDRRQEAELLTTKLKDEFTRDSVKPLDEDADSEGGECPLLTLQVLYNTTAEENVLLHEKISLLQQKTELLENLLAHNSEKIQTGRLVLEENYSLKVKILVLLEHVKELELKALKMTDLQIRYEDCMFENAKLRQQNGELERRVWSLESGLNIFHHFHNRSQVPLADELIRMRDENVKLSELLGEIERRGEAPSPTAASVQDDQPEVKVQQPASDLHGCCEELEMENSDLRRAITELQDESQALNQTTLAHRTKASRLAEENLVLGQKLAALKEEDLKETEEELRQTLQQLSEEKTAAQKEVESCNKQIFELCLQGQQLEDENRMLSDKDAQNLSKLESLRQQLTELVKETQHREVEAMPAEDKMELAACVSALEAELNEALEDTAQLEERNNQLTQQLSALREKAVKLDSVEIQLSHMVEEQKNWDVESRGLRSQLDKADEMVKSLDETLQAVNHQSACLQSDLQDLQQERDSLKHDVSVLKKQLQNVNEKNHVLERALHSSGLLNQSKKRYRDEMSRLMEQDQQLLRQENERLQAQVQNIHQDLLQSKEKVRQLDATISSLKQHKLQSHSSLLKALEQENAALKQELEAQRELTKGCEARQGHSELELLQQENEALKAQMARLSTQLLDSFQSQFAGLLPPSPHRTPRGQQDPDNVQQDDRERKMKNMEERMKEIELSLHNVKLLLKEKVAQLKEQRHKNGKADLLINDLYVENAQLLKSLEITEQRQKIAEKKNYLLEEKISSLNKIVRDLNPSSLSPLPFHYTCS